jgi:molybdopterin-guanine dinucleotide biosynthesis protein A
VESEFAAVVLAGGRARRFGGIDKVSLPVGDRSLLERTLEAVSAAELVVVVGPHRPVRSEVVWTREEPPGSGPLAGLRAGLQGLPTSIDLVAVLAADHPHVTSGTVARLLDALSAQPTASGAVLTDSGGRVQWLVGVWRVAALWHRMPTDVRDQPVRALLGRLAPALVPALGAEASDVDTPRDWRRATEKS